jgi:hypothetical protein
MLPTGPDEWKAVLIRHKKQFPLSNRTAESVKLIFEKMRRFEAPTGSGSEHNVAIENKRRAEEILQLMKDKACVTSTETPVNIDFNVNDEIILAHTDANHIGIDRTVSNVPNDNVFSTENRSEIREETHIEDGNGEFSSFDLSSFASSPASSTTATTPQMTTIGRRMTATTAKKQKFEDTVIQQLKLFNGNISNDYNIIGDIVKAHERSLESQQNAMREIVQEMSTLIRQQQEDIAKDRQQSHELIMKLVNTIENDRENGKKTN